MLTTIHGETGLLNFERSYIRAGSLAPCRAASKSLLGRGTLRMMMPAQRAQV